MKGPGGWSSDGGIPVTSFPWKNLSCVRPRFDTNAGKACLRGPSASAQARARAFLWKDGPFGGKDRFISDAWIKLNWSVFGLSSSSRWQLWTGLKQGSTRRGCGARLHRLPFSPPTDQRSQKQSDRPFLCRWAEGYHVCRRLGVQFNFFFWSFAIMIYSGRKSGVQDLHFTSYNFRCILRSISATTQGKLQERIRYTLQEHFRKMTLRRSQGRLGDNACRILGPVARPDIWKYLEKIDKILLIKS